jgi:D-serine deaminase-like pyridoxal phosphate-dependent protein
MPEASLAIDRSATGFPGAAALETPEVVVDRARLIANIARARAIVPASVALKPHVKTHKSSDLFALQQAAGAAGATASKPGEAVVFLQAGVPEVTVAYPLVDPDKAIRVVEAARRAGGRVRFTADSGVGIEALSQAARQTGERLDVLVEIDTGLKRCGVAPDGPAALTLASAAIRDPGLRFAGLFTHEGHGYAGPDPAAIRRAAKTARETMLDVAERLRIAGLPVATVSMGSTPTLLADGGFDGVTEVRLGNYVFLDLTAVRLGLCAPTDLALAVVATVVSANDTYALIDAGSKTLSSDTRPHSAGGVASFGAVYPLDGDGERIVPFEVRRLSEEHGWVGLDGRRLAVGTRVLVLPNHACVVANLVDRLTVLAQGAAPVHWPVAARGTIR